MNKLFAYPGGKWPIRHLVVSAFPDHKTYVDVFGGSAAILLTKEPSDGEIFNDKNSMLANFFRVVKHRPAELAERARHWIHSRELWDEIRSIQTMPADEVRASLHVLDPAAGFLRSARHELRDGKGWDPFCHCLKRIS